MGMNLWTADRQLTSTVHPQVHRAPVTAYSSFTWSMTVSHISTYRGFLSVEIKGDQTKTAAQTGTTGLHNSRPDAMKNTATTSSTFTDLNAWEHHSKPNKLLFRGEENTSEKSASINWSAWLIANQCLITGSLTYIYTFVPVVLTCQHPSPSIPGSLHQVRPGETIEHESGKETIPVSHIYFILYSLCSITWKIGDYMWKIKAMLSF